MGRSLDDRKRQLRRWLLRRPLTLAELADRIGGGVSVQALARPVGELVAASEAVAHPGRPARYSKPGRSR